MSCEFCWRRLPLVPDADAQKEHENPMLQVVGRVGVEITLVRSLPAQVHTSDPDFADKMYCCCPEKDFEPQPFKITIQRGEFVVDHDRIKTSSAQANHGQLRARDRYGLRLCFDQSLYPAARRERPVKSDKLHRDLHACRWKPDCEIWQARQSYQ